MIQQGGLPHIRSAGHSYLSLTIFGELVQGKKRPYKTGFKFLGDDCLPLLVVRE